MSRIWGKIMFRIFYDYEGYRKGKLLRESLDFSIEKGTFGYRKLIHISLIPDRIETGLK